MLWLRHRASGKGIATAKTFVLSSVLVVVVVVPIKIVVRSIGHGFCSSRQMRCYFCVYATVVVS